MAEPLLTVDNLSIGFKTNGGFKTVVKRSSFWLCKQEVLGIVGESGSGKSVSALAIPGLLPKQNARIETGAIWLEGKNLARASEKELLAIRGRTIGMVFQEPMSCLNPSLSCGNQVMEVLLRHSVRSKNKARAMVLSLFEKVRLPDPERLFSQYPHQLSGGQKQRIMIAMAIACRPKILIADEPTTALDVTVQKDIIGLLKSLQEGTEMGIIFISHDLALVAQIADRVAVMYQGEIVEQGGVSAVFKSPKHPYTKALLNSRPPLEVRLKTLPTIRDVLDTTFTPEIITAAQRKRRQLKVYGNPPLLEVRNIEKAYWSGMGVFGKKKIIKAVDNVSFNVYEGETFGLVGESGCGKSTLGNTILQLHKATTGHILYRGIDITKLPEHKMRGLRKEIQLIFQDPYSSLNPRIPVGRAIMEPMKVHGLYGNAVRRKEKTIALLELVGLSGVHFNRYPHEFSGGQRQRVGIARALAVEPKLIICDESVSALDIAVQAQVLNVLNMLKEKYGFTYIFIAHDLAVVRHMADQLLVMNRGRVEEIGDADTIYENPKTEYTKKLIDAVPKGI